MPLENEQIAAMAAWTLEDFQNDPLGAVEQVRELAAAHLSLQRERDAAVKDLEDLIFELRGSSYCERDSKCGTQVCYLRGDGNSCRPKWRGPQPEQVLAPADQSAGEYADNPVLAQA